MNMLGRSYQPKTTDGKQKLSVVVPSKTASNLLPCLAAVHQHEPAARLLVVDDGVDWDALTEMLRSRLDLLEPLWSKVELLSAAKPFI